MTHNVNIYTSWMHTIPVKCGCWPEQDLSGKEPLTIYPHGCPNFYNFLCENKMASHPRGRVYSPDEVLNEIFADPDSDLDKNSGEEEYEGESSPEEHSSSEDNIEGIGNWCVGHMQPVTTINYNNNHVELIMTCTWYLQEM